jgi:hypothetical protein
LNFAFNLNLRLYTVAGSLIPVDAEGDGDGDEEDDEEEGGGKAQKDNAGTRKQLTQEAFAASIADAASLLTSMGYVARADRARVGTVRFDRGGSGRARQTVP